MAASHDIKRFILLLCAAVSFLPVPGHAKEDAIVLLADAVQKGELQTVETLLANGADPNQRVPGEQLQYTPLFLAVRANQPAITRALLKAGADPAIEDENGDPVMTVAADPEHLEQAKLLIEHGVSIDFKNRSGITALLRITPYAEAAGVQTLIDLGADPNQTDPEGNTPLMLAVMHDRPASVVALIKAGAKIDSCNKLGDSAFLLLFANTSDSDPAATAEIVSLFITKGVDINQRDAKGLTPLLRGLCGYSPEPLAIQRLLGFRPDLRVRDESGRDALFHTVLLQKPQLMPQQLIDAGADPKTVDNDQVDLLMTSARNCNPGQVRYFINLGLDPKSKSKTGATAIHYAASRGRWVGSDEEREAVALKTLEIFKLLESNGGSLTAPDGEGMTPLHWASLAGTAPVVAYLLPSYPTTDLRDNEDDTPLHLAAGAGSTPVIDLLTPKYANIDPRDRQGDTPLLAASLASHEDSILHLLKAGADINAADNEGTTALTAALERDDTPHVRFLLEHGAKPDKIADPNSELLRAARQFHIRPISPEDYSFLIEFFAGLATDINVLDAGKMSPLMWIAASGNQAALLAILKHKPDLNARSPDGRTATMWAACAGATESLHTLREAGADDMVRDLTGRNSEDWLKWAYNAKSSSKIEWPEGKPSLRENLENKQREELRNYLNRGSWNADDRIMGTAPMHLAAALDDTDAIALLLERKAPPNQILEDLSTPLMEAATNGRLKSVEFLLEHGADPALRNTDRQRAIDQAVLFGHGEIVRLLLARKDSLTSDETSLLVSLVACGDKELLRDFLKAGVSIPPKDKRVSDPFGGEIVSDMPIQEAAAGSDSDFLKIFTEFPASTGADDPDYLAEALNLAADRGLLANVRYLVENLKVDPNSMTDDSLGGVTRVISSDDSKKVIRGFSPLSRALENGHEDIVRYLIDHDAIITGRTRSGAPPLIFAVRHRQLELLELFLKHHADTGFEDFEGLTALHVAAAADDAAAVRLLLDHGADPAAKNKQGQTPLDLARIKDAKETPALLDTRHQ